jgi:hypothetical protein
MVDVLARIRRRTSPLHLHTAASLGRKMPKGGGLAPRRRPGPF